MKKWLPWVLLITGLSAFVAYVVYKYQTLLGLAPATAAAGLVGESAANVNAAAEALAVGVPAVVPVSSSDIPKNVGQPVQLFENTENNAQTLSTAASAAGSGNFVGAAADLIKGLLQGHSSWYNCDKALMAGNWSTVANYIVAFYGRGGLTDKDFAGMMGKAGNEPWNTYNGYRYTLIPLVFQHTNNILLLTPWEACYNAGLILTPPPTS